MEEEFGGSETGKVRVLYEASGLGTVIVLDEVGQCAMAKTEGDSLTFYVLLTHTGNNLRRGDKTVLKIKLDGYAF